MTKTKQFFINAAILTASSLVMSSVSMSFTVYISERIGASGMGLYQMIMSVYRLCVTLATGGVGLAATRLVSEEAAMGNTSGAVKAVRGCIFYALLLSASAGVGLFLFSECIAEHILGDMRVISPLRTLAFSLPALSVSSVLSGYFTAVRRVIKSTSVLMVEQYVKISLSVLLLGRIGVTDLESACRALVLSGTAAEIISCMVMGILYLHDKKCHSSQGIGRSGEGIFHRMLAIAVPVAASSYLRSGLSTAEQMLIPWGLRKYGLSENSALGEYGMIGGMVMPVIMLPAVLVSSFSGLLVTEISALRAKGETERIRSILSRIFKLTSLFAVCVSGILCGFGGDIARLIYSHSRAASFITLLSPLVIIMYLDIVTDGMLKGLDKQKSHMKYNLTESAVGILLTVTLLPVTGIAGYMIVIAVGEGINFFLSMRCLVKTSGFRPLLFEDIVKPIFAMTLSVLIMRILRGFIPMTPLWLTLIICAAVLLYLCLAVLMGCVTVNFKKSFF